MRVPHASEMRENEYMNIIKFVCLLNIALLFNVKNIFLTINAEILDVYIVINFEKQMIRSSTNYSVGPGGTPLWQEAYTLYVHLLVYCSLLFTFKTPHIF